MGKNPYKKSVMKRSKRRWQFWIIGLLIVIVAAAIAVTAVKVTPEVIKPKNQATKDQPVQLKVDAKSAVVVDLTTGQVLGEKNADKQVAIASQSKLLVAYGVLSAIQKKQINWTDQVTIPASADLSAQNKNVYSHLDIKTGDKVSVRDLYWAMFTNSANDAAFALTSFLTKPGQTSQQTLESLASSLNLKGSEWYNGAGLKNGDALANQVQGASANAYNHLSAMQVAALANQVMNLDPTLKTLTGQAMLSYTKNRSIKVSETSDFGQSFAKMLAGLDNDNNLKIYGLKTGSTPEAGACFTGYVVDQQGHEFLTVINDAADYTDTTERFQKTVDIVNQVLSKKQPHSFSVGHQINNHKTVSVSDEKENVNVQVAANKTYWTEKKKVFKINPLSQLKSRPAEDSTEVVAYADPDMKATYVPELLEHQKQIPLTVLPKNSSTSSSDKK